MTTTTSIHDIKVLILSLHPIITVETVEEERVQALLQSVAGQIRIPLYEWSITRGLTRTWDPKDIDRGTTAPLQVLQHMAKLGVVAIFFLKDFARHLDDAAIARQFRDLASRFAETRSTLVLTGPSLRLPQEIEPMAVRYDLQLPGPKELSQVIVHVTKSLGKGYGSHLQMEPHAYEDLVNALRGLTLNQARQAVAHAIVEDGTLTPGAMQTVLQRKVQVLKEGGLLEYYPAEDNQYELGGFTNLKQWLSRAAVGFTKEARALNLTPPRGILFVGVQGCGKSLAAKAVARRWKLPLLKLDMGRLYDKYIGETEKNFQKAIALAQSVSPAVLWMDEIEKGLGGSRGGDADAGVSRRVFGAFLTWLQEKKEEVFVVGTANNLSALPPELLRKGRFDEIFFVDLPNEEEREEILKIHLRLRKQDPATLNLKDLVLASEGFSGAEIEQAIIASLYRALYQHRRLDTNLLLGEIKQTVPLSISRREDSEALRSMAQERFVSVR